MRVVWISQSATWSTDQLAAALHRACCLTPLAGLAKLTYISTTSGHRDPSHGDDAAQRRVQIA